LQQQNESGFLFYSNLQGRSVRREPCNLLVEDFPMRAPADSFSGVGRMFGMAKHE